jgi:hypothetical protein
VSVCVCVCAALYFQETHASCASTRCRPSSACCACDRKRRSSWPCTRPRHSSLARSLSAICVARVRSATQLLRCQYICTFVLGKQVNSGFTRLELRDSLPPVMYFCTSTSTSKAGKVGSTWLELRDLLAPVMQLLLRHRRCRARLCCQRLLPHQLLLHLLQLQLQLPH